MRMFSHRHRPLQCRYLVGDGCIWRPWRSVLRMHSLTLCGSTRYSLETLIITGIKLFQERRDESSSPRGSIRGRGRAGMEYTYTETNLADFDWPVQYETVCCPGANAATAATTTPTCPARVSSHFKQARFPELTAWSSVDHGHWFNNPGDRGACSISAISVSSDQLPTCR